MSELRFEHGDNDVHGAESFWSALSRESTFLQESAAAGITHSIQEIQQNPGKAIVAGATGLAISAPLLVLSWRYRALQPLLDVAGVAGTAYFASDVCSKAREIGLGAADYWSHPEHKVEAERKVSQNVGSIFVDSAAAYGGLWAGSRFTKKFFEPIGAVEEYYASKLDRLKSRFFPKPEEQDSLEIIDFDNDAYWANRARKSESSGFAGIQKSMEALMKNMPETSKRENELVASLLSKSKELVPGVQLRYVERTSENGSTGLRVGLKLPSGISMLGDEAFTVDSLAGKLSEAHKYRISADMTPVAGHGNLLRVRNIAQEDLADDAVTVTRKTNRFGFPFEFGKRNR